MAKKKFTEIPDGTVAELEMTAEKREEQKIEEAVSEVEEAMDKPEEKMEPSEELPEYARQVFKLYPHEDELYIDKKGGVFPKGTQPAMVGSAILFKNPFINN